MMSLKVKRRARGSQITVEYFLERSSPEPNSGCWIWLNAMNWNGYGTVNFKDRMTGAHRASYQVANNIHDLPPSIDVCHRCDNRLCVNPDHLFLGTRKDNVQDCVKKGRSFIFPNIVGEKRSSAKLTELQVLAIRSSSLSQRALARLYGVHQGTIYHILRRKTWAHI